jgi:hypothetical protein
LVRGGCGDDGADVIKVLSFFVFVPVRLFFVILSGLDVEVTARPSR